MVVSLETPRHGISASKTPATFARATRRRGFDAKAGKENASAANPAAAPAAKFETAPHQRRSLRPQVLPRHRAIATVNGMTDAATEISPGVDACASTRRTLFWPLVTLVVLVALAYVRVYSAGFVWDDDSHVTANPCIVGPLGLKEVWTSASANYFPLVLTNFWIQHALYGLNPAGYHLVNVACHALAAVLLYVVLRRLSIPGAWLGAALWALHPVEVESAAWISELKNTQSAVFFLVSILCYLRWRQGGTASERALGYTSLLAGAVAALLSKASTVMLPVALLLCAWWQEKRWRWKRIWELLPVFALSALTAAWTVWEQKYHSFALGREWDLSLPQRAAIAGKAVWFYLGKLLWPTSLAFTYPRWQPSVAALDFLPLAGAIAGLGMLLWQHRTRTRGVFFAAAYFVALLFPVLGFFNVYYFRYSFVADHFQYLASIGPLAGIAAGGTVLAQRGSARLRMTLTGVAAAVVLMLAWLSYQSGRRFADSETLWRATCAVNPRCWLGDVILGNRATEEGRLDDAARLERRALEIEPRSFEAHYNLGLVFVKQGNPAAAIAEYQRALQIKPAYPEAEHNLGVAYATADRPGDAIRHYERALAMKPREPETHLMLGLALALTGRGEEALGHYATALQLRPRYPEAEYAWGRTLEDLGHHRDAIDHYQAALRLTPNYTDARLHVAATYMRLREYSSALEQYSLAVQFNPDDPELRCALAGALLETGQFSQALEQFQKAVQLDPAYAPAHHGLAVALRKLGRYAESGAESTKAHRLRPDLY